MDERDDYGYGWCERGKRFEALKSGGRRGQVIVKSCRGSFPHKTLHDCCLLPTRTDGSVDYRGSKEHRVVVETWLLTCLLPMLKPGQVVIQDNATFHHGGRITALIEAVGCRVLYLPPYSPDFNRIEKCWAWLKSRIRNPLSNFGCLRAAIRF